MPNETSTSEIDTEPIIREIDIAAEPDTVFGFFVDPDTHHAGPAGPRGGRRGGLT